MPPRVDSVVAHLHKQFTLTIAQQAQGVKVLCYLEMAWALAAFVTAMVDNSDGAVVAQGVLAVIVMFAVALTGIYGAHKEERGSLLFFFIIQMWVISALTTYLQQSMREAGANDLMCAQLQFTKQAKDDGCAGSKTAVAVVKIIISILTFFTALTSSYMAHRLSEKIQDRQHKDEAALKNMKGD